MRTLAVEEEIRPRVRKADAARVASLQVLQFRVVGRQPLEALPRGSTRNSGYLQKNTGPDEASGPDHNAGFA